MKSQEREKKKEGEFIIGIRTSQGQAPELIRCNFHHTQIRTEVHNHRPITFHHSLSQSSSRNRGMAYITALNADSVPELQRDSLSPLYYHYHSDLPVFILGHTKGTISTLFSCSWTGYWNIKKAGSNANGLHVKSISSRPSVHVRPTNCRRLGNGTSQISSLQSPISTF